MWWITFITQYLESLGRRIVTLTWATQQGLPQKGREKRSKDWGVRRGDAGTGETTQQLSVLPALGRT